MLKSIQKTDQMLRDFLKKNKKLRIFLLIGMLSLLCVIAIKGIVRPLHLNLPEYGIVLQGILPNFFAATGIAALAFIYILFGLRNKKNAVNTSIIISTVFTFIVLTIWEFLQYLIWNYPLDYLDIIASASGSSLIVFVLILNTKDMKIENNPVLANPDRQKIHNEE